MLRVKVITFVFMVQSKMVQDNAQFIIILLPDLPSLTICELTQSFLFRDKCFLDLTKGWSLGNQCLWHYDIRWHQFHHYYTPNAAVINNFQMLQLSFFRDNLFLYSYIQWLGLKSNDFMVQTKIVQDNAQFIIILLIIILLPILISLTICELPQSFLFWDKCCFFNIECVLLKSHYLILYGRFKDGTR